jgi:hypothetical protein
MCAMRAVIYAIGAAYAVTADIKLQNVRGALKSITR